MSRKIIVITGASNGIGKFLFNKYVDDGELVFGTFNSKKPKVQQAENLSKVDVTDYKQVESWVKSICHKAEKLILINCVGVNYNSYAHKSNIKEWIHVINVNLIGIFNVIHAFLPKMRLEEYGRIINCSSVVAQMPVPGTSAYASSKSGLNGLCKSIASENAKKGITINNLNLGYHNIGMIKQVPEKYQKILKQKIPSGQFGDPKNIYNAVNYLVQNDYINGTSIDINGGII